MSSDFTDLDELGEWLSDESDMTTECRIHEPVERYQRWVKALNDAQSQLAALRRRVEELERKAIPIASNSQILVLGELALERIKQDRQHGPIEQHGHEIPSWISIARKQLSKAEESWLCCGDERNQRAALIGAAATLVACLEQHFTPSTPPEETKT